MLEHIENMRTKPEHIRRRYAFLVSFSVTSVIFLGWMASYGLKSSPVITDANGDSTQKVEAPLSSMTASVFNAFGDIKGMIFGSNKTEYSAGLEVTAGKR